MLVPTLASQLRVISQWIFSPYTASTRISSELSRVKTSERILFPVSTVCPETSITFLQEQATNQRTDPAFLFLLLGATYPLVRQDKPVSFPAASTTAAQS